MQENNENTSRINEFIVELYNLRNQLRNGDTGQSDPAKLTIVNSLIDVYKNTSLHEPVIKLVNSHRQPTTCQPTTCQPTTCQPTTCQPTTYDSDFDFDEFDREKYEQFINRAFAKLTDKPNFFEFKINRLFVMNYAEE